MKIKHSLLCAALTATSLAASAQIVPTPQQITSSGDAFASSGATFKIVGAETADSDAVNALTAALTLDGSIEIIIGEAGDDAIAAYADKIPADAEGYYLSVGADRVVIAGRDGEGTYYGVQSFLQLLEQPTVPAVEVTDYPTTSVRGVIEGYYGNPWSYEDCMDMYEFFDRNKMNTFIYGPKNDPYHKANWAEEYPEDQARQLTELATEGLKHKVHFTWAMHPGNSITGENMQKALDKFNKMYDLGIRRFAVFFDDISANSVDSQVEYLNYLNQNLVRAKDDVAPLIVCPTEYCISFAGGRNTTSTYLPTLGTGLDSDIEIMWTGAGVVDMDQMSAAEWFAEKTGRQPFIWLNYPVTDYGYEGGPLLLSPYQAADTEISTITTAFCSNPMEYYEASKIALFGIGDFAWNPTAYNDWDNWNKATAYLMPDHTDALRTYCYSNFYYPSNTHGLQVAYDETPEFTALQAISADHSEIYSPYFEKQVAVADELLALEENRFVTEVKEWIEVYRMQGERGLLLDSLRLDLENQDGEGFIAHWIKYNALTDIAANHTSRAGWDVRSFTPKSAPQFVEPFLKAQAANYSDIFRESGYDYPSDLFEPQILENGNYYILYKGKLLSNGSGAAANTPSNPTFRSDIDDINSARQAWKIKYDQLTGRYSILSAFDDRYVNEKGEFGTNVYESVWHTYEIYPLGGLYAIRNGGSAGTAYWTASNTRVSKGSNTAYNVDNFLFQIIPVTVEEIPEAPEGFTEGAYLIYSPEGQILSRATGGPTFVDAPDEPTSRMIWNVAIDSDSKRLKITQGGTAYINEKGQIGSNAYLSTWNSYEFYSQDDMFAIRNGDNAGTNFWYITDENKISNDDRDLLDAFNFRFVKYVEEEEEEQNAIDEVSGAAPVRATEIYDLQGRKVVNPSRGIYIQNGTKILIE